MKNVFALIIAIVITELAGVIGGLFTTQAIPDWYVTLAKPEWTPPNWLFGPVWIVLYALMGVAAFLVWKKRNVKPVRMALGVFAAQLALNLAWSLIFFGWRNPGLAFAEIVVLWLAIVWTAAAFYKVSKPAAWLLFPYLLWVSFAACLNYVIWMLN